MLRFQSLCSFLLSLQLLVPSDSGWTGVSAVASALCQWSPPPPPLPPSFSFKCPLSCSSSCSALSFFLVPGPQRWEQRGLGMKRSSTTEQLHQWTEGVVVWSSASAVYIPQRRCRGRKKREKVKICARIPHLPDVSEGGRHNSCWWRRKKGP